MTLSSPRRALSTCPQSSSHAPFSVSQLCPERNTTSMNTTEIYPPILRSSPEMSPSCQVLAPKKSTLHLPSPSPEME